MFFANIQKKIKQNRKYSSLLLYFFITTNVLKYRVCICSQIRRASKKKKQIRKLIKTKANNNNNHKELFY